MATAILLPSGLPGLHHSPSFADLQTSNHMYVTCYWYRPVCLHDRNLVLGWSCLLSTDTTAWKMTVVGRKLPRVSCSPSLKSSLATCPRRIRRASRTQAFSKQQPLSRTTHPTPFRTVPLDSPPSYIYGAVVYITWYTLTNITTTYYN